MKTLLIMLSLVAGDAFAAEQFYKCKAADGSTKFSAEPCGADAKPVVVKGPPRQNVDAAPPAASSTAQPTAVVVQQPSDAEQEKYARQQADRIAASCRDDVWRLENAVRAAKDWDWEREAMFVRDENTRNAWRNRKTQRIAAAEQARATAVAQCDERWLSAYQAAKFR